MIFPSFTRLPPSELIADIPNASDSSFPCDTAFIEAFFESFVSPPKSPKNIPTASVASPFDFANTSIFLLFISLLLP